MILVTKKCVYFLISSEAKTSVTEFDILKHSFDKDSPNAFRISMVSSSSKIN